MFTRVVCAGTCERWARGERREMLVHPRTSSFASTLAPAPTAFSARSTSPAFAAFCSSKFLPLRWWNGRVVDRVGGVGGVGGIGGVVGVRMRSRWWRLRMVCATEFQCGKRWSVFAYLIGLLGLLGLLG